MGSLDQERAYAEGRQETRSVPCPECQAQVGQPCRGTFRTRGKWAGQFKPRQSNHRTRIDAFRG